MLPLLLTFIYTNEVDAQSKTKPISDPVYIQSYDTMLTTRVYLSQKYLSLNIRDKDHPSTLKYRPNSKLNLGIGVSYGPLTINLSAGPGFLNNSKDELEKGKTSALDLQAHLYGPKLVIDFFAQHYKGFYLLPKGSAALAGKNWYTRPDISLFQVGVSGYHAFNWRRFSYRAAYLQNEWQIKSAGSILLGAEIFYEDAKADSAFVPAALKSGYQSAEVKRFQVGDLAPGAGYAYTLVVAKHFFISGALTGSLSANIVKEYTQSSSEIKLTFNPNYAFKAGVGYNSRKFTASFTWVNNTVVAAGHAANYQLYAGNARIHLAYRFVAGPRLKRKAAFMRTEPM